MTLATDVTSNAVGADRPRRNSAAAWVLSALVAVVLVAGAAVYVWWHGQPDDFRQTNSGTNSYPLTESLRITVTGQGDLVLRAGFDTTNVEIKREYDSGSGPGAESGFSADGDNGVLGLSTDCAKDCRVTFTVWVPLDTPVEVVAPAGVALEDVTGKVSVQAGGDVTLRQTRIIELSVTGAGDVTGSMAAVPNALTVDAKGDVDIDLPADNVSYAVQVTGSGDRDISVRQDTAAASKVTINLGSGDLRLR